MTLLEKAVKAEKKAILRAENALKDRRVALNKAEADLATQKGEK